MKENIIISIIIKVLSSMHKFRHDIVQLIKEAFLQYLLIKM